jgi:hypothetical protein
MSVENQMSDMDKAFKAFAEQAEKEAAAKKSGGGGEFNYEQKKFVGLIPNEHRILRLVGGYPDSGLDQYTARTIRRAKIVADDGKGMIAYLPLRDDPSYSDYVLWKIINKVNEVVWVNKKKYFVNEKEHADIFSIINKNGIPEGDKKAMFDSGWAGKELLYINVIDREAMDWHRTNKHTALLAKNINVTDDGTEWVEEGVSAYSFLNELNPVVKVYGNFNNWDISIMRTGTKDKPYVIKNASKYVAAGIPEIPEDKAQFVSLENLTEEENSWGKYDLVKNYKITSFTKIYNRLKGKIKKIDVALGTDFLGEVIAGVEAEKASRTEEHSDEDQTTKVSVAVSETVTPVATPVAAPPKVAARPTPAKVVEQVADFVKPEHWGVLTADEKSVVSGSETNRSGEVTALKYSTSEEIVACTECGFASPLSFHACPNCGVGF